MSMDYQDYLFETLAFVAGEVDKTLFDNQENKDQDKQEEEAN